MPRAKPMPEPAAAEPGDVPDGAPPPLAPGSVLVTCAATGVLSELTTNVKEPTSTTKDPRTAHAHQTRYTGRRTRGSRVGGGHCRGAPPTRKPRAAVSQRGRPNLPIMVPTRRRRACIVLPHGCAARDPHASPIPHLLVPMPLHPA